MRCSIPRAAWCSARPTTVCRCRWPCSIGCSSPEVSEKSLMIMHRSDQALAIRALRSAAPYIRMYKGKTFVVKAGGGVFADPPATRVLVEQIAILHHFGVRVVLVHGGGPQLTELSAALGVPTRMVDGRRVTDQRSIDVTAMVLNGLINTRLLGLCRDLSIEAVGISGVDAGLVRAHKRAPVRLGADGELIDFGFVGDIDAVDTTVLRKLLDNGLMPVVSPLSADESGTLLNINADTVAAALGAALQAEKLILCTGAPGILGSVADPRSLISYTDLKGLKRLRDEGHIAAGMLPKAKAIEDAIRGGVRRVHVVSYQSPEGILGEVFTNEGTGTLIVADVNALTPAEQQSTP
ncbi:MAG: acetylglutamate kinase [Gammaproteobacteria bacterium]|nr:MAG: acetylglutamate kinase [Gammaproteobacteria bacterium]TLZ32506.1 MAG: acetylglutamate kinase [Gammaproteobacteria bacterium]TLZ47224.1 MAG: acetylglutamate kinase [Gammaproteobacteria bacterium]